MSNYFFTADEHYGHYNMIKFCARPFYSTDEMDEALIQYHNEVVGPEDTVVHAGDFTLIKDRSRVETHYVKKLNGNHIFLQGSHDYWLREGNQIWQKQFGEAFIVVCHYAMRTWARSHYNSWQLYGHSHGRLPPAGKQHDVGVDNSEFRPVSLDQIVEIMKDRPDNFNLIRKK